MQRFKILTLLGINYLYQRVVFGGAQSSDGSDTGAVVVLDKNTTATKFIFKASVIGHAAGTAVMVDLSNKQLTRYRFKPSATMRSVEDAANVADAESWLQVDVAPLANGEILCNPPVTADTWSDWHYFSDGNYLTNLWFALDAAGVNATALVEAE